MHYYIIYTVIYIVDAVMYCIYYCKFLTFKTFKKFISDRLLLSWYQRAKFVNTSEWVIFKKLENWDAQLHN